MILPTTRRAHVRLGELVAQAVPPPRAFFVDELEGRLADLMRSSATADVLPEVELAPARPREDNGRPWLALAGAALSMLLVVALAATLARIDHEHRRELRVASAGAVADGADRGGAPDSAGAGATRPGTRLSGDAPALTAPAVASPHHDAPPAPPPPAVGAAPAPVAAIAATANGTPAGVSLTWGRYHGADFAAYLVLRSDDVGFERQDRTDDGYLLLRVENREMLDHQDTPRVGTTPRYRVVVVSTSGTVVARSPIVTPWRQIDDQATTSVTLLTK